MTVNPSGWRPSSPANEQGEAQTVTGNRALMLEEPLLFEIGTTEQTGVDFDFDPPRDGEGDRAQHGGGGVVQGDEPPPSVADATATLRSRGGSGRFA